MCDVSCLTVFATNSHLCPAGFTVQAKILLTSCAVSAFSAARLGLATWVPGGGIHTHRFFSRSTPGSKRRKSWEAGEPSIKMSTVNAGTVNSACWLTSSMSSTNCFAQGVAVSRQIFLGRSTSAALVFCQCRCSRKPQLKLVRYQEVASPTPGNGKPASLAIPSRKEASENAGKFLRLFFRALVLSTSP